MDLYPIDVTATQIEQAKRHVAGRIRQTIQEGMLYGGGDPGTISGLMADLRALDFIKPMDARDLGQAKGPAPDDDGTARQQRAERAHNAREEARSRKAS